MTTPRSQQEYYDIGKNEIQTRNPNLTDFSDGSILDIKTGLASVIAQEITRLMLDKFKRTYFSSSEDTDLEFLATDHFGDNFARPADQKAVGIVTFERPDALAGDVLIDAGTFVKTATDANGESQRFTTLSAVTLTGLSINASIEAVDAGLRGNVGNGDISIVETALTDPSVTVTNNDNTSGGANVETDAEYRETISNLIEALKGATLGAVRAVALNVSGIETATAIEFIEVVKKWDEGLSQVEGPAFRIPRVKLYIADANGVANAALLALVETAVEGERACGVYIEVLSAVALSLDWTATLTLNPGGPNYATLQTDTTIIVDSMTEYVQELDIGADFNRVLANAAIMAIWGPSGTGDLTDFQTTVPAGDIDAADNQKLIPGTIQTA